MHIILARLPHDTSGHQSIVDTITPIRLTHAVEIPIHYRYDVILPLVGCIVLISIAIVWLILIYKKKSNKNKYLGKDFITSEEKFNYDITKIHTPVYQTY